MKIRNLLLLLISFLVVGSQAQAQHGLHLSQFQNRIWAQKYQPAHLTQGEFSKFRYGGQAGLYLGNNQVNLEGLLVQGGFITDATKDRIISELGNKATFGGGYDLGVAAVNVKFGEGQQTWGFYLEDRLDAVASFNEPRTFGLITKGNGPYAGETISDADIFARVVHSRKIGVGTAWTFDKLRFGARLNLVQGVRMLDLNGLTYELYTAPQGTQIQVAANYNLEASPTFGSPGLFAMQGFGASADLGVTYSLNEKINLEAAVLDLGFTSWQTNKIQDDINVNWEGVFITSLFEDSIPERLEKEVDSLRNLIFPDTVESSLLLATPLSFRLGAEFMLSEKANLGVVAIFNPTRTGAFARLPLLNVRYRHEVIEGLHLGANAYAGGLDTYGFGVMGSYRLAVKDWKVDLTLGSDNLIGYLLPSAGRGFSFFGGIGVQL